MRRIRKGGKVVYLGREPITWPGKLNKNPFSPGAGSPLFIKGDEIQVEVGDTLPVGGRFALINGAELEPELDLTSPIAVEWGK